LKFLIDTQLPPSLEALFFWKGHEAKHTTRWTNGHLMNDAEILSIARDEDFIIITKDKDFLTRMLH
jgi:predicted nuclease of predicted toxin-antitoxin system